jgi:polyisoprenoid-binding protein YceI
MSTTATPESATTPTTPTTTSTWTIDPAHSLAEFKVRHMMVSNVKGAFTSLRGVLTLDAADVTRSHIEAEIDASSITTREPQRDTHLKSADFFDVEKFPTLSFTSTGFARAANGGLDMTGDLTMHGITRRVVFTVDGPTAQHKDPWGNTKMGASATTQINRKDFGLVWNAALETGGLLVGDEVTITLEIEFAKA